MEESRRVKEKNKKWKEARKEGRRGEGGEGRKRRTERKGGRKQRSVCVFRPRTQEAQVGRSLFKVILSYKMSLRPAWAT